MIATKELVKLALCYVGLMVSLSKCEIDSSSSITTTTTATAPSSGKAQPEPEETVEKTVSSSRSSLNSTGFSLPFPEKTVKTSFSIYSSSSSLEDEAVPTAFNNNVSEQWQKQNRIGQQQADGPNNANIISGTTTPSPASEILTSSALQAPPQQQEVEDSDKEEVAQQQMKWGQQQQEPTRKFAPIPNKNNDNKRQTVGKGGVLSSSFGDGSDALSYSSNINAQNYFETMSEFGSHFPESKITSSTATSKIPVEPDTISIHSADSSSSLSRGNVVPFYGIRGRRTNPALSFSLARKSNQNESVSEMESDSLIPTNTWIPAGLAFSCKNRFPGYYADASPISKCQVYHMCMTDGRKYTLLCGIGTVFNQLTFVCDHWYNYKCAEAESDYKINRKLWEDVFSEEDDDADDKQDDELENYNLDNRDQNGGMELKENLAAQSFPSRSHFMVTNRIRKSRFALS